jgi:hypothetical protein
MHGVVCLMPVSGSNEASRGVTSDRGKMAYESPALVKYGNVAEITRHSGRNNSDNPGGGRS